jgi:hypothetical protein
MGLRHGVLGAMVEVFESRLAFGGPRVNTVCHTDV